MDDAEAFKDEAQASKEVISVLRKEIDQLEMEKETLWVLENWYMA